ncbi:nuclear transport factor 2 family protein [Planctomycetales bacterium ZRK34]|nr:nuclear transport factor 2 family protein [Planctomycetales bacterium ZRK34]
MNTQVPSPVAAYLAAEKAKDTSRLILCFHKDAVVFDEGKEHRGIAAIEVWYRDTNAQYRYVVEPLDASINGQTVIVRTHVTGNFPGGAADLCCTFQIDGDQIKSLEITQ